MFTRNLRLAASGGRIGVIAARTERWATGYVDIPISAEAGAAIQEGRNCLAVHCHQDRGRQYIDVGIAVLAAQ